MYCILSVPNAGELLKYSENAADAVFFIIIFLSQLDERETFFPSSSQIFMLAQTWIDEFSF